MIYALREGRASLLGSPLLSEASAPELRILLCLIELGSATADQLAESALCSTEEAVAALQFWRGAGMVRGSRATDAAVTQEKKKQRSALRHQNALSPMGSEKTAKLIEEKDLADFLDACQQTAGHIFNSTEMEIAVALCEQLGLAPEYVLTLIAHCYGLGKRSMQYVEKVAFSYTEKDIDTPEKLEAYLEALELLSSHESKLRRLFGIGGRALSSREKAAFTRWLSDFGYRLSMIEAAYDKTVNSTGKASVAYTDKILCRWHEKGCKTVAEAEALEAAEAASKGKKSPAPAAKYADGNATSFNVYDAFNRALERSYGKKDPDKKD